MEEIYFFYTNYCPYIKRKLCSSKDLYEWYLEIDRYFFHDAYDFFIFLVYLEENNLVSPLIKSSNSSELFQSQTPYRFGFYDNEELLAVYHPIQFIQILTFIEQLRNRNSMFSLNYWCDPDFLKLYWEKCKQTSLDNERIINIINIYPKIEAGELKRQLKQIIWLKPSFLKLWIKLESIWNCKLFAPIDINMHWDGAIDSSRSKFYERFELHNKWAQEEINKFTKEDVNMLFQFDKSLMYKSRLVEKYSDLNDLFYLISYEKRDRLSPLALYLNILEISRELKTIYWTITKSNTIGKEIKPPFIFEEEKEMLLFHNNVLLEYGLFPTEPFLVFVEGGTEYEILNIYKRRRPGYEDLGFVNIQGTGNLRDTIQNISNYFKNRLSFILLDYDTPERYINRKNVLVNHKIDLNKDVYFFIPDFVTENFTVNQVLVSYLKWLDSKELDLKEGNKNDLISQLEYAEDIKIQFSKDPTKQVDYNGEIRFEHILINNTLKYFRKKLDKLYPRFELSSRDGQRSFSQQFKREFCPFLTDIVIEWFIKDNQEIFSFETALDPFYKRLWKYRIKLMEKKFHYSSFKFFY